MNYEISLESCRLQAEESLCFTDMNETPEMGCIGHLRGDFDTTGNGFYTTWFDHQCKDQNDSFFKHLLDTFINQLREDDGLLSTRRSMRNYCRERTDCKQNRTDGLDVWKFRYLTKDYAFYLRCKPQKGDYDFYVYCYDRNKLFAKLANEKGMPLYCYGFLPTSREVIRIDYGEMGYCPIKVMATGKASAREMNREIGVSPAQAEAMLAGSMFGWNYPCADPKQYDEKGKPIRSQGAR